MHLPMRQPFSRSVASLYDVTLSWAVIPRVLPPTGEQPRDCGRPHDPLCAARVLRSPGHGAPAQAGHTGMPLIIADPPFPSILKVQSCPPSNSAPAVVR